jgi:hypothetical protein
MQAGRIIRLHHFKTMAAKKKAKKKAKKSMKKRA